MTPPLSRDLRSPCGLPAARLSGKPKQKDSENGKALKNRGLRGSKRIYRNFVAVLKFQRSKLRSRICESLNPIVINKWYRSRLDKRECAAMLRAVK